MSKSSLGVRPRTYKNIKWRAGGKVSHWSHKPVQTWFDSKASQLNHKSKACVENVTGVVPYFDGVNTRFLKKKRFDKLKNLSYLCRPNG